MPSFASDRVLDAAAHVSYACPQGWVRNTEDLIAPFTATIRNPSGAMVASGRWEQLLAEPPSTDELIGGAAWLASEYGEYFLPVEGERVDVLMERTTVAGRPAARAGYRLLLHPDDGAPAYVRVLVLALSPNQVSFLLTVAPDTERHVVDGILASAQPTIVKPPTVTPPVN